MNKNYFNLYIKYKKKYLNLKKLNGGEKGKLLLEQLSKTNELDKQERIAIEKFKLGTVDYHKGPIEIFLKKKGSPISSDRLKNINLKYNDEVNFIEEDYILRDDQDGKLKDLKDLFVEQNAVRYEWYGIARGHTKSDKTKGFIIKGIIEVSKDFHIISIDNICQMKRSSRDLNKLLLFLMRDTSNGAKTWEFLVTPVRNKISDNIANFTNDDSIMDLKKYHFEIKLINILFKYYQENVLLDQNIKFSSFKINILNNEIFSNRNNFISDWYNLKNIISQNQNTRNSNINDDLLDNDLDEILVNQFLEESTKNDSTKLLEYLNNSDLFTPDHNYNRLIDSIRILEQASDEIIKDFSHLMNSLKQFEITMNSPRKLFGLTQPNRIINIDLFEKWFNENSTLFNQYLYVSKDKTFVRFNLCPRIKNCPTNSDDESCNIYPQLLKPNVDDDLI